MFFDHGVCAQCGSPVSQEQRSIAITEYHSNAPICSRTCFDSIIKPYIRRYQPDNSAQIAQDKEAVRRLKEEYKERWNSFQEEFRYYTLEYDEPYKEHERIQNEWDDFARENLAQQKAILNKDNVPDGSQEALWAAEREFNSDYAAGNRAWFQKQDAEMYKSMANAPKPVINAVIPDIEEAHWYSHCLLLAQIRFGKTNTIRWRLNQLLPQIAAGKASVILMEPKGVLTEEVLRLAQVWDMRDRVAILDPRDTRVSVNIFDKGDGSDYAIEQTLARVERVLNNVTTSLTPFQVDALTYALRAMFYVDQPGSIRVLTKILEAGLKGLSVRGLPYVVERYFASFKPDGSSQQVVNRLNGIVANPVFEALFDATRSTFNMLDAIQVGKLIVINASAANLLYCRFWIEQVNACITPRYDILKRGGKLTPTTFIIDECQTWLSEDLHFAGILDKAAEAKLGMLIACHHMNQIKDLQVRGSIYTNMALKFAARTTEDVNHLCGSMGRTEPDFVRTLPKYEFAYFAPDMDEAIKVKVPLVEFDKMPRMSESQYQQMRADNRKRYSYLPGQPAPSAPTAPQAAPSPPPVVPLPVPTPRLNPRSLTLLSGSDGHVHINVSVNGGASISMMIDTGASDVCLSPQDAEKVGFNIKALSFTRKISTANGIGYDAPVMLKSLRIGDFEMCDVQASIAQNMNGSVLGQTFLRRLASYQMTGRVMTLQWPDPSTKSPLSKDDDSGSHWE